MFDGRLPLWSMRMLGALARDPRAGGRTERPLFADQVWLDTDAVGVRAGGTRTRHRLRHGPITTVGSGTVLWELLRGASLDHVFDDVTEFERAVARAQTAGRTWRPAADVLTVETVVWDDSRATLVHATE